MTTTVASTPRDRFDRFAATIWGDLFEVAVKRGCLAFLESDGLLKGDHQLAPWNDTLVEHLHDHLGLETRAQTVVTQYQPVGPRFAAQARAAAEGLGAGS